MRTITLTLLVVAAFVADMLTTGIAFRLGAVEANPIMKDWSFLEILFAKAAVLFAVVWYAKHPSKLQRPVLAYGAIATGSVAIWNAAAIVQYLGVVA